MRLTQLTLHRVLFVPISLKASMRTPLTVLILLLLLSVKWLTSSAQKSFAHALVNSTLSKVEKEPYGSFFVVGILNVYLSPAGIKHYFR
ncbi:protein of unknown function [Shewanella benthica]|uniref:Uncharacterized protein n=1 Tax=Shewanella benthica TaxID=43661 RepID=A0A330M8M8_9GAMM|nr:protein of unknown function [Shewanella benthica]